MTCHSCKYWTQNGKKHRRSWEVRRLTIKNILVGIVLMPITILYARIWQDLYFNRARSAINVSYVSIRAALIYFGIVKEPICNTVWLDLRNPSDFNDCLRLQKVARLSAFAVQYRVAINPVMIILKPKLNALEKIELYQQINFWLDL